MKPIKPTPAQWRGDAFGIDIDAAVAADVCVVARSVRVGTQSQHMLPSTTDHEGSSG